MSKLATRLSLLFAAVPLAVLTAVPAAAACPQYFTDFNGQQPELFYENYEGGVRTADLVCGTDACTTFETQGQRTFGRFAVNPSATPGFYTNTAVSQAELGVPGGSLNHGPYTISYGHPLTMEAKIKWSNNYDLLGLSDAQGTSGIVLWNSAFGEDPTQGATPEYDQIGFTWASIDVFSGLIAGFSGSTFVDQLPLGISRPVLPIDIHNWIKVKMIWSENSAGVQTVTYYADGQLLGTDVLPVRLEGMGLEIWNDNQEPYICEEFLCPSFPNPSQTQSFYVDYVKIS